MATILQFPASSSAPAAPAAPAPVPAPTPPACADRLAAHRKDMLAKIHMAKSHCMRFLPGYDDTVYRSTLETQFAVSSAADLSIEQMHDFLLHFTRLGWQKRIRKGTGARPAALGRDLSGLSREGLLAKIEAMLTEKGRTEGTDVPWAYAVGILKRQSKGITKSLDQADREQLQGIIAALYRDAQRKGRRVR